jgi:ketosteroid isomerase-like protein
MSGFVAVLIDAVDAPRSARKDWRRFGQRCGDGRLPDGVNCLRHGRQPFTADKASSHFVAVAKFVQPDRGKLLIVPLKTRSGGEVSDCFKRLEVETMPATNPEEICQLFQRYIAEGDLEPVLSVYESEAVILNQSRELSKGLEGLKRELEPLAKAKVRFDFEVKQVIENGGIALMHTEWTILGPEPMKVYAIEVARRQRDGSWRWLIGDPFTVNRSFC